VEERATGPAKAVHSVKDGVRRCRLYRAGPALAYVIRDVFEAGRALFCACFYRFARTRPSKSNLAIAWVSRRLAADSDGDSREVPGDQHLAQFQGGSGAQLGHAMAEVRWGHV